MANDSIYFFELYGTLSNIVNLGAWGVSSSGIGCYFKCDVNCQR